MKKRFISIFLSIGITLSAMYSLTCSAADTTDDSMFYDTDIPDESMSENSFAAEDTYIEDYSLSDSNADSSTEDSSTEDFSAEDISADDVSNDNASDEDTSDNSENKENVPDESQVTIGWPAAPELHSDSIVLLEDSTNTVLYSKNSSSLIKIGSPVKIMTVLVALENGNLSDSIAATDVVTSAVSENSANISLKVGETLTLEDYLYAIMLASANDASLQVAETIGGSVEGFVDLMNQKAEALGCTNTHFENPTGFSKDEQITTADDFAKIMQAAADNEDFQKIASAAEYTINATDSSEARTLRNSFALLEPGNTYYSENVIGGKEGYSEESLSTLACASQKNGLRLIAIVFKGEDDETDEDALTLLNYGFDNFKLEQALANEPEASGGTVVIPSSASIDQLNEVTAEKEDGTYIQYFFEDHLVGTGKIPTIVIETTVDSTEQLQESAANLQNASDHSVNKSYVPYFIIWGITAALLIALLTFLIKFIKKH